MEPTIGIEPMNLFLTKEVLYLLSYVGLQESGNMHDLEKAARDGRTFVHKERPTDYASQGNRQFQLMACSTCDNDSLSGCHYLLHGPQFDWW